MASLTITPSPASTGDAILIAGEGFATSSVITVAIPSLGVQSEITSDAAGFFGTDDIADHATATLTSTGTNVSADDTVTLGAVTYTFKASVAATANEVKVGTNAADSLLNLKAAINLESNTPAKYGTATVIHPTISCRAADATHLYLFAKTGGTGGNSLASTEASTQLSFGGGTFSGGSAATGVSAVIFSIEEAGTYLVQATDGTNSASASVQVWSS